VILGEFGDLNPEYHSALDDCQNFALRCPPNIAIGARF
jgi:hypothetical protein